MAIATDRDKILLALYAWLDTQDISSKDWGPLFAVAAGTEVYRIAKGDKSYTDVGLVILKLVMEGAANGK